MKRELPQIIFACALLICGATLCPAQDRGARNGSDSAAASSRRSAPQSKGDEAQQTRTSADETYELNISERRITERDFAASTSVEAGEESARGLRLRIGVGVGAEQIDVLLRNVRGQVRFRGTLERVLELINSRHAQDRHDEKQ